MADQELIIRISGTAKDFVDELNKAKKKTEDLEKALVKTAKLSSAAFVGVVAAATTATQAFARYEQALVGVGKTTNVRGKELEQLGLTFQKLSQQIPVATTELLAIAQAGGQLGVRVQDLEKFTETVAKLGFATDLSGEEAATALARIINVTRESISDIDKLGSVIVALGNNFAASESEITRVATEVARSTSVYKLSSAEVVALATAMRSLGIQAQLGGSAVGRAFREIDASIRQGGQRLQDLSNITGIAGDELKQRFQTDAVGVFREFIGGLALIEQSGGSTAEALAKFGLQGDEINKVLPVLATGAEDLNRALALANEEVNNATALNQEAGDAFATLNSEQIKLQNTATNLAVAVGAELAPSFKEVVTSTREWLEGLLEADSTAAQSIATFLKISGILTGLTAVLATLAFGYIRISALITATNAVLATHGIALSRAAIQTNALAAAQAIWNFNLRVGDALLKPFVLTLQLFGRVLGPIFSGLKALTTEQGRNNLYLRIAIPLWEAYARVKNATTTAISNVLKFLNPLTALQRTQNALTAASVAIWGAYNTVIALTRKGISDVFASMRSLLTIQNAQALLTRTQTILQGLFTGAINLTKIAVRGLAGATGIGLLLVALSFLVENFDKVQAAASGTFSAITAAVKAFARNVQNILGAVGELLKNIFTLNFDQVGASLDRLKNELSKSFNDIGKEAGAAFNKSYQASLDAQKLPELPAIPEVPGIEDPKKEAPKREKVSDDLIQSEIDQAARIREIRAKENELLKEQAQAAANERVLIKDAELQRIAEDEKKISDARIKFKEDEIEQLKAIDQLEASNAELTQKEQLSSKEQAILEANERELETRRSQLEQIRALEAESAEVLRQQQEEIDQRKLERQQEIGEEEAEIRLALQEIKDEERALIDEADIEQARATIETKRELEEADAAASLAREIQRRNQFIKDEAKFGKTLAELRSFFSSQEIQLADQTAGQLVQLTQSKNSQLKAIGKAASLVQIGIKTAEGAISAYSALAGIPIVGPALGAVAAGALIAFGAEQAAAVVSAQRGGIVPPASGGANDRVPAMLQPGELIVPAPLAPDFIQAVGRPDVEAGGRGGSTEVVIGFTEDAIPYIEQKLLERRAVGTGSL